MPHHTVQRGHDRKAVFVEASDYQHYLDDLEEWQRRLDIKVYGYCLMTNHIHLIVEPGEDNSISGVRTSPGKRIIDNAPKPDPHRIAAEKSWAVHSACNHILVEASGLLLSVSVK